MGQVTQNGDLYTFTIPIENLGDYNDTNVVVVATIPTGMQYNGFSTVPSNVGTVTFNNVTKEVTWNIGLLQVGQSFTLKVKTKIIDITEGPFTLTATVSGDNIDPNAGNNTYTETVTVTTCAPSAGALGNANSCMCGDLKNKDTVCDHGTTEFRLVGSPINLDGDFDINTDGTYNIMGHILNPLLPASFSYSIWCIVGGDEYETSGPAIVTIPALLGENATDELIDNEDGTYTHKAMDGTEVTFNTLTTETIAISTITASVTNITSGNFANHYKINDSDGSSKVINLPLPSTLLLPLGYSKSVTFKRINNYTSPGSITIAAPGGVTIDGVPTYTFPATNMTSITLFTDGTNYFIK